MTSRKNGASGRATLNATSIDLAIRIAFLGLITYWSLKVLAPFLTIILWSGISQSRSILYSIGWHDVWVAAGSPQYLSPCYA